MEPWYRLVTLREEVREGRSFSPDEFAIALEQVVAGRAPNDYREPAQFFSRTCFTRALSDHAGMVLRRLAGETANTAPVLTLVTQFGGGKTHTLTALYHLANAGAQASRFPGVADLLARAGIAEAPSARVGVFVGNAWDPAPGRETPWLDLARQLAGDQGVAALGPAARTAPPGTEALTRVFAATNAPVLLLFDEVLNFVNRHRGMAEGFHAFIQNLTVAAAGTSRATAVVSLPRSQVEMTDWDQQWHERITKVVRRVARDLIANDESEISEVVRRRLFEDLGSKRTQRKVARAYANWCFERSARLPAEWLAVDTATTEARSREFLRGRFEACYPFHPATLSVFQRKWRALAQFQQTRGALAMLAQWISWAARQQFTRARTEPLITLGSAPLDVPEFRTVVLGQLGEDRLDVAIEADLAGPLAHAKALDVDARGALRDIHRRVGTAILFESSGGQVDKVAHLPELRFALGEPEVDTATVDNAAAALETAGFFIRKVGTDGYRIHHQATLKKVVSDRRASLDEDGEIKPAMRRLVDGEFRRDAALPVVAFPPDNTAAPDSPRLALVVLDPETEWRSDGEAIERVASWTRERGTSPRLYPASLVWCARQPGRELRDRVALWLAWQRVAREVAEGVLGAEFDSAARAEAQARVRDTETAARDEVWAGYRFVALADSPAAKGLRTLDLGAGHMSASETLSGRILAALRSEALLSESVGAGYLDRHWPPAFAGSGAWPLSGLRQSFLDGSLTRLLDPDTVLRRQIATFVSKGEFGLGSGARPDGAYGRLWFAEPIDQEEVTFESSVFLLTREKARELRTPPEGSTPHEPDSPDDPNGEREREPKLTPDAEPIPAATKTTLRLAGTVPPEVWNRLGTRVLPKLRSGDDVNAGIELSVTVDSQSAATLETELRQILEDLSLSERVTISRS
ncbi:MAG: ATP-binding protein [Acidobacteria bacterium]|nr:ATP-binding protein [Acidobacteriota bacterium]MYG74633.1 ATP-binding protein [Acidobacteriota bacterium]